MTNPYTQPAPPMTPSDEKLVATLTHIGGIFFGFWVPLVTYLIFRDRGPLVRQHTATALNFQLTMLIAVIVGAVLVFVLVGFVILAVVPILVIIFGIMAAVAANNGQQYTYPLTITFVN
jgi:uncharacterized protein